MYILFVLSEQFSLKENGLLVRVRIRVRIRVIFRVGTIFLGGSCPRTVACMRCI